MTRAYALAKAAAADLREITRYTVEQWGVAQARTYANLIEDAAADLASSRGVFKDLSALHPVTVEIHWKSSHLLLAAPRPPGAHLGDPARADGSHAVAQVEAEHMTSPPLAA